MKMVLQDVAHGWIFRFFALFITRFNKEFHLNSMWVAPFVEDRQVSTQNCIENLAVAEIASSAAYFNC
jgi:hypothetical protein